MNKENAEVIANKIETEFPQLECCVTPLEKGSDIYVTGVFPHRDHGIEWEPGLNFVIRWEHEYEYFMTAHKLFSSSYIENKFGEVGK